MSDYNIDKIKELERGDSFSNKQKWRPQYIKATLFGLVSSIVVAIILAALAIWWETELMILLIVGAILVAGTIHFFVPKETIIGAIIGGILCPVTYLMYQFIMTVFGYYYEDSTNFWWMLGGSVILGGYLGYNKENND